MAKGGRRMKVVKLSTVDAALKNNNHVVISIDYSPEEIEKIRVDAYYFRLSLVEFIKKVSLGEL